MKKGTDECPWIFYEYLRYRKDKIEELDSDFLFKVESLKDPLVVKLMILRGLDYSVNQFELLEIALRAGYYESAEIVMYSYFPESLEIFNYGFSRKNSIILDPVEDRHAEKFFKNLPEVSRNFLSSDPLIRTVNHFMISSSSE